MSSPKSAEDPHSGWSGFMKITARKRCYEKSAVIPLPFVNLQPSNPTSINTSLRFAAEECRKRQQRCIVTFDHPLFIKAMNIVSQVNETDELFKVIVRIGGYHLLVVRWAKLWVAVTSKKCGVSKSEERSSLCSGIVADDRVNYVSAEELSENAVKVIVGKIFADVTLKRKEQVYTLTAMGNTIIVDKDPAVVNPNQLLHLIACVVRSANDLEGCLQCELAPYPQSLFDDVVLRAGE
ncbi:hypothetical protein AVEN_144208-1 [Araneus ventricosus]|uniref:Uncharacterized protein n=1 Tax=Araneus ventricosus TaxID=182803 RepID=A0A4Y2HTB4_ARAVE|nr:hypothetical protein AVEN_144208-1 [Araneus ventricosus]